MFVFLNFPFRLVDYFSDLASLSEMTPLHFPTQSCHAACLSAVPWLTSHGDMHGAGKPLPIYPPCLHSGLVFWPLDSPQGGPSTAKAAVRTLSLSSSVSPRIDSFKDDFVFNDQFLEQLPS